MTGQQLPAIIADFLRYERHNNNLAESTLAEYKNDIFLFLHFMLYERGLLKSEDDDGQEEIMRHVDIAFFQTIDKNDIYLYIDHLRSIHLCRKGTRAESVGLAATTTNRKLASLKTLFRYLAEIREVIDKNPTATVNGAKTGDSLPIYLTKDECGALFQAVSGNNSTRDFCILVLFVTCGLRISELKGIDIPNIRTDIHGNRYITIRGKGNKERTVYLGDMACSALADYLVVREAASEKISNPKDTKALFLSQKNNRISDDAIHNMVKKTALKAGLSEKISAHKLRHTAATILLQSGIDIRTIQGMLGHENISTTQIYTHFTDEGLIDASKKMDEVL